MFDERRLVWLSMGVYIRPRKEWVCCIYTIVENKGRLQLWYKRLQLWCNIEKQWWFGTSKNSTATCRVIILCILYLMTEWLTIDVFGISFHNLSNICCFIFPIEFVSLVQVVLVSPYQFTNFLITPRTPLILNDYFTTIKILKLTDFDLLSKVHQLSYQGLVN